jgi:hypothetical protein
MGHLELDVRGFPLLNIPSALRTNLRTSVSTTNAINKLRLQIPINALFFISFGGSAMFGVWLNSAVVPAMGYAALFNILGVMSCISMVLNYKLEYTFETFMPFDKVAAPPLVASETIKKDESVAPAEKEASAE